MASTPDYPENDPSRNSDINPKMQIHSDAAWDIASRWSWCLASDTRTLAAQIDVALENVRADLAKPKVKPLVWDRNAAKGGGAKYNIYETFKGWNCTCYPHEDDQYRILQNTSKYSAKAAAQADYERRILDTLDGDA